MDDEYQVVSVAHGDRTAREPMGSKDKFWFRGPGAHDWLFKFPSANTGGHWAEKIAFEIAVKVQIPAAIVELAVHEDAEGTERRGSICRRFPIDYELYHGNQILAGRDPNYARKKKYRHKQHTASRILNSMTIFRNVEVAIRNRRRLASYLVLDALIGNVDRHHENWGILRKRANGDWRGTLAPTFDHASSLGRELRDADSKKSRERYLHELGVDHYARHARGAVFASETDTPAPSPLELIRRCLADDRYGLLFTEACQQITRVDPKAISEDVVARVPGDWMTPVSREFAVRFLYHNHGRLAEMVE